MWPVSFHYLGEAYKNNRFFLIVKKLRPPLPLLWPPQFFSDNDFLDLLKKVEKSSVLVKIDKKKLSNCSIYI